MDRETYTVDGRINRTTGRQTDGRTVGHIDKKTDGCRSRNMPEE